MVGSKDVYDVKWAVDYRPPFETLQNFQIWSESENFCSNLSHIIDDLNRICLTDIIILRDFGSKILWL